MEEVVVLPGHLSPSLFSQSLSCALELLFRISSSMSIMQLPLFHIPACGYVLSCSAKYSCWASTTVWLHSLCLNTTQYKVTFRLCWLNNLVKFLSQLQPHSRTSHTYQAISNSEINSSNGGHRIKFIFRIETKPLIQKECIAMAPGIFTSEDWVTTSFTSFLTQLTHPCNVHAKEAETRYRVECLSSFLICKHSYCCWC